MSAHIEDDLRQSAITRILREFGAIRVSRATLEEYVKLTPEVRAAEEIKQLRSRLAMAVDSAVTTGISDVSSRRPKYKSAIAACARWESDSILEWVTYHKSLGFDHIYLYCNDDDPLELYERLCPLIVGDSPFVTFIYYPFVGLQTAMYKHFLRTAAQDTEWFIFLDIDEFIALKQHPDIHAFIRDYGKDSDAVYLNWIFFGNNGHVTRPTGSVLAQYISLTVS